MGNLFVRSLTRWYTHRAKAAKATVRDDEAPEPHEDVPDLYYEFEFVIDHGNIEQPKKTEDTKKHST